MNQTISFITLGVSDLARSRAFYAALGWRESSASQPAIAFYRAGTVAFALFERSALAADAGVAATGSGFRAFTLAHNVASSNCRIKTRRALRPLPAHGEKSPRNFAGIAGKCMLRFLP